MWILQKPGFTAMRIPRILIFCFLHIPWTMPQYLFSIFIENTLYTWEKGSFRPLSRGPFFNFHFRYFISLGRWAVFVPFLGDLFSIMKIISLTTDCTMSFRPLSRGPFFNSVPAKPQTVCSRKRIRGGNGGIASSGTLLRR